MEWGDCSPKRASTPRWIEEKEETKKKTKAKKNFPGGPSAVSNYWDQKRRCGWRFTKKKNQRPRHKGRQTLKGKENTQKIASGKTSFYPTIRQSAVGAKNRSEKGVRDGVVKKRKEGEAETSGVAFNPFPESGYEKGKKVQNKGEKEGRKEGHVELPHQGE